MPAGLDQHHRFKISSIVASLKPTLEVNADVFEWTLKMFMSFLRLSAHVFNQAEIVENTNGLCGIIKLCISRENNLLCDKYILVLPFLQLLYSLWK